MTHRPSSMSAAGSNLACRPELVKYIVGLRLASVGIHTFREAARRIGAHEVGVTQVVTGARRTPRIQRGLAVLCGVRPHDLFGDLTHPSLLGAGDDPRLAERGRIRALLRGAEVTPRCLAEEAGYVPGTVRRLIRGDLRSPLAQFHILRAFRHLTGSPITMVQFWGRLTAREVA